MSFFFLKLINKDNLYSNQVPTPGSNNNTNSNSSTSHLNHHHHHLTANSPAALYQNYVYSPATPGAYYAPQTPGTNLHLNASNHMVSSVTSSHAGLTLDHFDWHTDGLMVLIKDICNDKELCNLRGIIKSIHGSQCSLHLIDYDKTINILLDYLEPLQPLKGDRCMIIIGDDKGSTGRLLSIDSSEGVIKLENNRDREEITMKPLKYLCKLADI